MPGRLGCAESQRVSGPRFLTSQCTFVLPRRSPPGGHLAIMSVVIVRTQTRSATLGYMLCSSLMLLINKLAVSVMPSPALLLIVQMVFSTTALWLAGKLGLIKMSPVSVGMMLRFAPAALVFVGTIFTNIKTLQYSNVETLIVFRASTPLAVSVFDFLVLDRELPSARSVFSLVGIMCGAFVYVLFDNGFEVRGYVWVALWYSVFVLDQVFIKFVFARVKVCSNWDRVFNLNIVSIVPLVALGAASGELTPTQLRTLRWTEPGNFTLLLGSCMVSVGIGYFAALARSQLSATSFAVVGNVCKCVTILLNAVIGALDNGYRHASLESLAGVSLCLIGAAFYEQAPVRSAKATHIEAGVPTRHRGKTRSRRGTKKTK